MPPDYDTDFIYQTLKTNIYCVVSSHASDGTINCRVMDFACTKDLREFFLLTLKTTEKLKDFARNPDISILVFTTPKGMPDYSELAVKGKISTHTDIHSPVVQNGLRIYTEKTGIMKALLDNDSLGDYVFLVLEPKEIAFNVLKDIMRGLPATKINF